MVVDCLLDAVETFSSTFDNGNPSAPSHHQPHHLSHIQLVSNELHSVERLIQCIKQRLRAQ